MSERNPVTDPTPGDILRWRDRERHVIAVEPMRYWSLADQRSVLYDDVRKRGSVGRLRCSMSAWNKWARRVETAIIQRGNE